MFIDYDLLISNKQALVASAASTSYIDAIQAGWGADDEVYARFQVSTAFAGTTTSSVTLAIQIAQDTSFATLVTVAQIQKQVGDLTVNSVPFVVKLPAAMMTGQTGGDTLYNANNLPYRYIRAYYTLATGANTGSVTCFLSKITPTTIDKVK